MLPPLAVDIDGTLTRPNARYGIDPRVLDALRAWEAPVVVATGKAFPYPVALCLFVGIDEQVIAENGGIAYADDEVRVLGDATGARRVVDEFVEAGGSVGWGDADTVNRWRETELAVSLDADEALLRSIAAEHGLEVVDTGYAYHVKDPSMDKGEGLRAVADILDLDPASFVAVGDSENDAATFELARRSYAVANADQTARAAADVVLDGAHADGFLEAVEQVRASFGE